MPLFSGKHTFRLAVIARPTHMGYQPAFRVVSNPVEVEIQAASVAASPSARIPSDLIQNTSATKSNLVATPDQSADLKARFSAAKDITAFTSRDTALAVIARDAAKAGNFQIVRDALGQMTAFPVRDKAALESARELLRAGHRAEAIEVAKTITSFTERDAALKELAQ